MLTAFNTTAEKAAPHAIALIVEQMLAFVFAFLGATVYALAVFKPVLALCQMLFVNDDAALATSFDLVTGLGATGHLLLNVDFLVLAVVYKANFSTALVAPAVHIVVNVLFADSGFFLGHATVFTSAVIKTMAVGIEIFLRKKSSAVVAVYKGISACGAARSLAIGIGVFVRAVICIAALVALVKFKFALFVEVE